MKIFIIFVYYWTYFNLIVFLICVIVKLMALDIVYPDEWNRVNLFTLGCSFAFFSSPIFSLYMRDRFDLMKMTDGKSYLSQLIWIFLGLLVNVLALIIQFVWVNEVLVGRVT